MISTYIIGTSVQLQSGDFFFGLIQVMSFLQDQIFIDGLEKWW